MSDLPVEGITAQRDRDFIRRAVFPLYLPNARHCLSSFPLLDVHYPLPFAFLAKGCDAITNGIGGQLVQLLAADRATIPQLPFYQFHHAAALLSWRTFGAQLRRIGGNGLQFWRTIQGLNPLFRVSIATVRFNWQEYCTFTGQLLQLSILHKNYCFFSPFPPIMAAFSVFSFCLLFLGAHF